MLKSTSFIRNRLIAINAVVALIFALAAFLPAVLPNSAPLIVIFGIITIIITTATANYLVIKPLCVMLRNVREIRHGNLPANLSVDGHDEIAQLAWEYNRLHDALNHCEQLIEQNRCRHETHLWSQARDLNYEMRRLEKCSKTDALTGLSNRGHLDEKAQQMFINAKKNKSDLACIMIDIDNFKPVNDNWGHAVGDKVIAFTGKLLQAGTRNNDLCARFGGDEFILLLDNCPVRKANEISERLRQLFSREVVKLMPKKIADNPETKSIIPQLSIGLATLKQGRPKNTEKLMEMADIALYQAKEKGKNQVVTYVDNLI